MRVKLSNFQTKVKLVEKYSDESSSFGGKLMNRGQSISLAVDVLNQMTDLTV